MLPDGGHTLAINSTHMVEPAAKWPFPGYVACGTGMRQRRLSLRATDNSVRGWTFIRRRVHADCVRKVTAVGAISLVHRTPCAASTLSTGVPHSLIVAEELLTCSVAEDLAGIRRVVCTAACMTL